MLVSVVNMENLDIMVSLVRVVMLIFIRIMVVNFDNFVYYFSFENHYGAIILVDNVVVDKKMDI